MDSFLSFNHLIISHFERYSRIINSKVVLLDGRSLELAEVIAVARHGKATILSENAIGGILRSADALQKSIADGEIIYGVNTGFGGSADTRTQKIENLQREIIRGLNYGIVDKDFGSTKQTSEILPIDHETATYMPESWVRGMMVIRLNSLASGASGVRLDTIKTLVQILNENIVPITPLRGSISASGDLSPLSYIGSTIQGKSNTMVWAGEGKDRRIINAQLALARKSISKVHLGPKEGLAIVNGTATSTSLGALAMHEVINQAALAHILTAMSVEALLGTDESFDPFFSEVRPHPGQRDCAAAISSFLRGSSLMHRGDGSGASSLRQDRYSIRTAPQWIGPILEDFTLAHKQVTDELNSTTDNPLIDTKGLKARIIHGGNFQAKSITSAMDKTRQGVQGLGRMLFAQCTELINPATNRGLPPNLVFDEPSESYIWKGTDIMIAALTSELGFLANPVGTHVQSAEMGNQSLNSLALISARYTLDAISILTQLSSAHLVALCQALDLRAMNARFLETLQKELKQLFHSTYSSTSWQPVKMDASNATAIHWKQCWLIFTQRCSQLATSDSVDTFTTAIGAMSPYLLSHMNPRDPEALISIQSWSEAATQLSLSLFWANKDIYFNNSDATPYLGAASSKMYTFVRKELGIPFIRNDSISTPLEDANSGAESDFATAGYTKGMAMGDVITIVYQSQRRGELYKIVADCFNEIRAVSK